MIFNETPLKGAFVIEIEKRADERGFFARTFCQKEFEAHGLNVNIRQCNTSMSLKKGTLRGLHFQLPPHEEAKYVRCTVGAVFDVVVDIRAGSPTFGKWFGVVLSAENFKGIYVPEGFAHGVLMLEDNSVITYQVSEFYAPGAERGLLWNDPDIGIEWAHVDAPITISDKDAQNMRLSELTRKQMT